MVFEKIVTSKQILQFFFTLSFLFISVFSIAQINESKVDASLEDSVQTIENETFFDVSAYIDAFYVFDFNKPTTPYRLPYFVNHNRHNEFNVNYATISAALVNKRYLAKIVIQSGTYANDNYGEEDNVMQFLNEAKVGVALLKNSKLWLEAGILKSHFGFEDLNHYNDLTLTRSFMAETIPYYLTGAALRYLINKKWTVMVSVVNGWQIIRKDPANSMVSFASQVFYMPNAKTHIAWNAFIGTNDPDSTRRIRYYNDFYFQFDIGKNLSLQAGIDFGMQQKSKGSSEYNGWFVMPVLGKYRMSDKLGIGGRIEFISDVDRIVVDNPTPNDFICWGMSLNFDYIPIKNAMFRIEGRYLIGENPIFIKGGVGDTYVSDDFFISMSLSVNLDKHFKF